MKIFRLLFRPRTIWFPTLFGWLLLSVIFATPIAVWWIWGESFLCYTKPVPADILVVEGWIKPEALEAAAAEFSHGGYRCVITTGGLDRERRFHKNWTYAEIGYDGLVASGVPREKIIQAPCAEVETQRTHESAVAAKEQIAAHNLQPAAINVFTLGAHARRSHLVYEKVFAPSIKVGIISWLPAGARAEPWWHSTTRARSLLTETIGYLYEGLFNSGRGMISTPAPDTTKTSSARPPSNPSKQ